MSPLRLAIVTRRFWPLVGGAESAIANLAVELTARGCRVTILTAQWNPAWPATIRYYDVPVMRLPHPPQRTWAMFRYMRSLSHWCKQEAHCYDVVYVSAFRQEAYAVLRALGGRLPVVLRAERAGREGDCLWQAQARCGGRIKRQCRTAAALVAPNRAVEHELIAAGYPPANIRRIANGVPIPPPRTRAARTAARASLGAAHPALVVGERVPLAVYTGHLHPRKGLKTLVAAWDTIVARWPTARLWLAGDGPARTAIERQIEAMNLAGRAATIGVFDTVDELLAAADLYAFPAQEAGTSMALLEAMAAGLPIVAADIPGHQFLIADDRHGLLVPPNDVAAMSAAIHRLFDQPELAERLGGAARERAVAEFSIARMADEHLTLFDDLISAKRGTTGGGPARQNHP